MDRPLQERLELAALPLAGIVVAIHLWWGIQRFVRRYLIEGIMIDPRPLLFLVSSLVILAGIAYVSMGGPRRPVYIAGIGLMITYISGYFWWHSAGHMTALPWVDVEHSHHGEINWVQFVIGHARTDTIAMVSKAAEALLAVVLAALLYLDFNGSNTGQSVEETTRADE